MTIQQKSFCTFLLKFKNIDVVVNPTGKEKDSIVVYSINKSPYLSYVSTEDQDLIIDSAGEYESKDVFITGKVGKEATEVVYTINSDDLNIGVISFINNADNVPVEFFETADIILIGAGGGMFFTPKDAENLLQKLSPKIAIIFGFKEQASKDLQNTLFSLEEVQKDIPGMKLSEKSMKITKEDLERIENMEVYYFE
jgi:hypothetical protein